MNSVKAQLKCQLLYVKSPRSLPPLWGLDYQRTPRLTQPIPVVKILKYCMPLATLLLFLRSSRAPLLHQHGTLLQNPETKALLLGTVGGGRSRTHFPQSLVPSYAELVVKCFYYFPALHTTLWSVVPRLADPARFWKLCFIRLCFFQSLVQYMVHVRWMPAC